MAGVFRVVAMDGAESARIFGEMARILRESACIFVKSARISMTKSDRYILSFICPPTYKMLK